jgi:YVTN family beta-propeller protein
VLSVPVADRAIGGRAGRAEGILSASTSVQGKMDERPLDPPRLRHGSRLAGAGGRLVWALAAAAVASLAVGCTLHQAGVLPPEDRIFFPGGAIVGPGGGWLYVVNSNSDLRYNAGTILAVNLPSTAADLATGRSDPGHWASCPSDPTLTKPNNHAQCCWDVLDPLILNCDERVYVRSDVTVRIGSFAGQPVFQRLKPGSTPVAAGIGERMFVPVRGNGSVTLLDLSTATPEAPRLYCTGTRTAPTSLPGYTQEPFAVCDPAWTITRADDPAVEPLAPNIPDNEVLRLPDEAYALAVDDLLANPLLYVGHLSNGALSLVYLGTGEDDFPELLGTNGAIVPPDANGARGLTSLRVRYPGPPTDPNVCGGPVYATSRYRNVASSFVVAGIDGADCTFTPQLEPSDSRTLAVIGRGDVLSTGVPGTETRGIEFMSAAEVGGSSGGGGDVIFLLQRTPPVLAALDASTNLPFATVELCQGPVALSQQKTVDGVAFGLDGPSLFVTCFDSGEVYVIDASAPRVKAIIPVGRGPVSIVFDETDPTRGYIVGFGANNVSVVDLDPASPTHYRVIQRIGFPSPAPRELDPL